MRIVGFTCVFLTAVAAAFGWAPPVARACSCLATPIYKDRAEPKDGARNVPANFAPVIEGSFEPGSVTVEDQLGQPVDVTINEGPSPGCPGTWAEIVPKQPWALRTTYIIRVKPGYPSPSAANELSFVTGTESLPESELTVPKARLSMLTDVPDLGSCGPFKARSCLNVEGQTEDRKDVEVIARRGDQLLLRTLMPANDLDYAFKEIPDCLELRRRSPTGKRSEPLLFCGEDLHAKKYVPNGDKFDSPLCEGGAFKPEVAPPTKGDERAEPDRAPATKPIGTSNAGSPPSAAGNAAGSAAPHTPEASHHEYGCSAAPGPRGNAGAVAWILAALFLGAVRRRRSL